MYLQIIRKICSEMKSFHTSYGLLGKGTSRGVPGFAVNRLWVPARPLLSGLEHFHGVPFLPKKHLEDACTEDVGWAFKSSSPLPLLESESVSMSADDTSSSSPTAPKKSFHLTAHHQYPMIRLCLELC